MIYSEISDVDIALAVGKIASFDGLSCIGASGKALIHDWCDGLCIGWKEFDPCNSWADAGPIIQEQKISINAHGLHVWMAWINKGENIQQIISGRYSYSHIDESPLRAAMIVFLMMQEGK